MGGAQHRPVRGRVFASFARTGQAEMRVLLLGSGERLGQLEDAAAKVGLVFDDQYPHRLLHAVGTVRRKTGGPCRTLEGRDLRF